MPSRPFPPSSNPSPTINIFKTKAFFLAITLSSSALILIILCYILFHLYYSIINPSKTIPFDSNTPLKLHKFSYKELNNATNSFSPTNLIGKGGSGMVYRGVLRTGKSVAVKKLDSSSLQAEREFQNELQILGGIRSQFIVTLLGYCIDKKNRILVYEYMPNKALQESLFDNDDYLDWDKRFSVIKDIARGIEFLHLECEPPVIHGDVKPSNVLLDKDYRAKVSDFGLSRLKVEEGGEFGVEMFSQELSGNFVETPVTETPVESINEVDFALALQASCSSKNTRSSCYNVGTLNLSSFNFVSSNNVNNESSNGKGKEVSTVIDIGGYDWNKFVPYDDDLCSSIDHSKELKSNVSPGGVDYAAEEKKQWGKDWWWRQDGSGELCSKDYVTEWIGSQICPSENPDWDGGKKTSPKKMKLEKTRVDKLDHDMQLRESGFEHDNQGIEKKESKGWIKGRNKRHRKMQEWWREEHLDEISKKGSGKLKKLETKWKKGFKMPGIDISRRFQFRKRRKFGESNLNHNDSNGEFSFRRGWKKNNHSGGSEMWSGDLFSRELSSTTSMRGTLCYVAPEYGGCGFLMEKSDIYSLGVLILVIVSGRRPLHVLSSPMKLEKANLVSWCRHLAQTGNIIDLVDEKLKGGYNKEQACLCINLALACLQKMPELRPDIGDIVKILKGEMDLPPLPFEFSPSPPSKLLSRSRRKLKANAE